MNQAVPHYRDGYAPPNRAARCRVQHRSRTTTWWSSGKSTASARASWCTARSCGRLATIAAKTGDEASGDDWHPITVGWDSSGNRRELRLYRATDNTLILGGALITSAGALTTEAGVTPAPRVPGRRVPLRGRRQRGRGGTAAADCQPCATRYWSGYIETAVGTTPNLPIGFDGVVWTGVDSWSRDPLPGSAPAGRTRWFGSAEAYHTPGATFDWTIQSATVRRLPISASAPCPMPARPAM